MTDPAVRFARDQLRAFVERIEKLEEEVKAINDDKRDVYGEAKANGFDVKALKAVIAYRRKDAAQREEHEAIVETYLHALGHLRDAGTPIATRVRAHEDNSPPSKTAQSLQASVALARAGADPFEMPDIPAALDRRSA